MWIKLLTLGVAILVVCPASSSADVGPPAHLQVIEQGSGVYTLKWRVPKALPVRAIPTPDLPDNCEVSGDPQVAEQSGAWLFEQDCRCETGLSGQLLGMAYPFPDLALTTVMRVDLHSGDRFAHVLTPGEGPWRVPEGTASTDWLGEGQRAILAGARHVLGSWVHWIFLFVLCVLGTWREPVRLITAFTVGQLTSVVVLGFTGISPGFFPFEIGLAVVIALLARQALQPAEERRRMVPLSLLAGVIHGVGLAVLLRDSFDEMSASPVIQTITVLGMDAIHLLIVTTLAGLRSVPGIRAGTRGRRLALYGAGALSMAMAVTLTLEEPVTAGATASALQLPGSPSAGRQASSQRVAPAAPEVPLQSFVTIEPFEIRHEVMVRLAGMTGALGLEPGQPIDVETQPALLEELSGMALQQTVLEVDGLAVDPSLRRADFMTVGLTGALPRANPVAEDISSAVIGIVVSYPIPGVPETVALSWMEFPDNLEGIPATMIDPESVANGMLTREQPTFSWMNQLLEDPIPTVEAVPVEPTTIPLPWVSLALVLAMLAALVRAIRSTRPAALLSAGRVLLAAAILSGPLLSTAVALPGSAGRMPSENQARRILAGLLPNIYRALEFRDEGMIYDRLAVSVTGETLSGVYLQQRRTMELEERGGAQARVESVEILQAGEIVSTDTGFEVRAEWTVGGMVTHFGHRHFRQNRHDARITITPGDGTWKIQIIDVLEQERIR